MTQPLARILLTLKSGKKCPKNNHIVIFNKVWSIKYVPPTYTWYLTIARFCSAITSNPTLSQRCDVIFAWPLTENIVLLVECEYDKVVLCCNCTLHEEEKNISKLWHFKLAYVSAHPQGPIQQRYTCKLPFIS